MWDVGFPSAHPLPEKMEEEMWKAELDWCPCAVVESELEVAVATAVCFAIICRHLSDIVVVHTGLWRSLALSGECQRRDCL